MTDKYKSISLIDYPSFPEAEMQQRANSFYSEIAQRRSIRDFSDRDVPFEVIQQCLLAAGTAPNGANLQPWHFAIVRDPETKRKIREAAEKEEYEFYHGGKAPQSWLNALAPLGTDESKPFLEIAPYLIVVFAQAHAVDESGKRQKNYYVSESVGIATGFLIAALHHCGLGTLTHTPSPMKFLNKILGRPTNERPFVLLVVGYPADDARVPKITKKSFEEITSLH
ncbi:MAG: nitroreductase family protein [Planctomycetota bacterium]